jgi:hypothetical protein
MGFNIEFIKNNVRKSDGVIHFIIDHLIHETSKLIIQDTNCFFFFLR